jgi:hypothetical protein
LLHRDSSASFIRFGADSYDGTIKASIGEVRRLRTRWNADRPTSPLAAAVLPLNHSELNQIATLLEQRLDVSDQRSAVSHRPL